MDKRVEWYHIVDKLLENKNYWHELEPAEQEELKQNFQEIADFFSDWMKKVADICKRVKNTSL